MTQQEKLDKLLEVADKKDRARLTLLHNAVVGTMKAYKKDPTAPRKRDWDVAEDGLRKEVEKLWKQYFTDKEQVPEDRFLSSLFDAMTWLRKLGYKISKSKIYRDKDKGLIFVWPDGRVYKADAELYARKHLVLEKSPDLEDLETKDLEELQRKKLQAEVERLKKQINKYELEITKEQKKYILKADFSKEMARRLLVLEQNFTYFFRSQSPDLIDLVDGDQKKVQDFIDALIEKLHQELNEFASTEKYHVVPLELDEEDTDD